MSTDPTVPDRRDTRLPRAVAIALLVLGAVAFAGYGLFGAGGEVRCTTEYAAGAPGAAPAGQQGPVGLPAAKQTCAPVGLTDPPLVVLGIVFLVLAVPALGVSQLGFAGVTLTRAVTGAADAAKSASQAADRAVTAVSAVANLTSARSASAAAGNTLAIYQTGYTGDPRHTDFLSVENAVAFTLAANGVTEAVQRVATEVTAAVLLWRDPATDSLRSALRAPNRRGVETLAGVDIHSELGAVVRKGLAGPVTITDPADAERLGLDSVLEVPATAAAIPVALPGRAAVGLILAFIDDTAVTADDADDPGEPIRRVIAAAAPFALPAAVLIERLTIAGERAIL